MSHSQEGHAAALGDALEISLVAIGLVAIGLFAPAHEQQPQSRFLA
jgi:hypothetical protein